PPCHGLGRLVPVSLNRRVIPHSGRRHFQSFTGHGPNISAQVAKRESSSNSTDLRKSENGTCPVGQINDYYFALALCQERFMPEQISDLVEISKLNGDFRRNYGRLIGAYLYLRSISAARGRRLFWGGFLFALLSAGVTWLERQGLLFR